MEPFDYLSGEDENVNDYCCDDKEDVDDDDQSNDTNDDHCGHHQVVAATYNSITLKWRPGFNGGFPQVSFDRYTNNDDDKMCW